MDPLIITVALAGTPEAATADFVCDGINDDVEINAALAQAGAAGGGIVRLAPGNYSTGLPIVVYDDNVSMEGDPSGGTTIRPDSLTWVSLGTPDGGLLTGAVNFVGVDNFAARFLTIEFVPSTGAPPGHVDPTFNGIQAIPTGADGAGDICTNGVFEGNTIRCAPGHTYSLWSLRSEGMQIIDNLIEGGSSPAGAHPSQEGIEIYGGRDVLISGNTITGIGNAAIQLGGLASQTPDCSVDNIIVTGNSISNCRVGVFIGTTYGSVGGAADVTNILIENNDFQALFEAGLMIRNWTGSPVDPPELSNIVFRGNDVNLVTAAASGYTPMAVWLLDLTGAGNSVTSGVLVENNDFSTTTVSAVPPSFWLAPGYNVLILIQDFAGASITGNRIEMADSSAVSRAIAVIGSSEIAITGNDITGAGLTPIEFYQSHDFVIDANSLADWGRGQNVPGILVGEATDYSITDNVLHGAGGDGANMISVYASGAATSLAGNVRVADADATLAGSLFQHLHLTGSAVSGTGNSFANTLIGNDGANILLGGGGVGDVLIGLGGNDIYYTDVASTQIVEVAGGGTDALYTSVSYVLGGNAQVEILSTNSHSATSALSLTGNGFAQTIVGNAGNNIFNGGGGNDVLYGFGGNDIYYIDVAGVQVIEAVGGGNDAIYTSVSYTLAAGQEVELLSTNSHASTATINLAGNTRAQTIVGNAGSNTLDGGGGNDTLIGLGGNDIYLVDNANIVIQEGVGGGTDIVYSQVSYVLNAGANVEFLSVNSFASTSGYDLTGNEFAQTVIGNNGVNVLNGGLGNDVLTGNGGADSFAFTTALGPDNVDAITDFVAGIDRIALDDAIFTAIGGPGALNPNAFVTGAAAADASNRIVYESATGQLFYDADGNGAGAQVLFATLTGAPALTASDFTMT